MPLPAASAAACLRVQRCPDCKHWGNEAAARGSLRDSIARPSVSAKPLANLSGGRAVDPSRAGDGAAPRRPGAGLAGRAANVTVVNLRDGTDTFFVCRPRPEIAALHDARGALISTSLPHTKRSSFRLERQRGRAPFTRRTPLTAMDTEDKAAEATCRKADKMYKAAAYFEDVTEDCDEVLYSVVVPQLNVVGDGPTYEKAVSDAGCKVSYYFKNAKYYGLAIPSPYSDAPFYKDLRDVDKMSWPGETIKKIGETEVGPDQSESEEEIAAAVEEAAARSKEDGCQSLVLGGR